MAKGAPSHTLGLSFTRKPQPKSTNWRRTWKTEVVAAASGAWGGEGRWQGLGAAEMMQCSSWLSMWPLASPSGATTGTEFEAVQRALERHSSCSSSSTLSVGGGLVAAGEKAVATAFRGLR